MLLQITLTSLLTLTVVVATPPPGYQAKDHQRTKHDPTEPKYKYAYKIIGEKGSQEKQEQREGIYALGRYYVQGVGSKQSVEYLADDWGYHPFIEYSNVSPHSKSSTQIAFGEEAVKALQNSQKNLNPISIKTSFQQAAQTGSQQIKTSYLPSNSNYHYGNKAVNSYASFQQGSKSNQNQQQNYKNVNQGQRQEINHHHQQQTLKPTVSYYTNHPQIHGSNRNQHQSVNPIKTFSYYTRHQKPQQKLNIQQQQQFGNQQQHLGNQKQQFGNQQQQFGNQKQQFGNQQVKEQVPTVSYYSAHQQSQVVQNLGNGNQQGQEYYNNQAQQLVQEEAAVKVNDKEVSVNQQIQQEQVSLNNHQQQQVNNQVLPTVSYYVNQQNPQVTLSSHQEQVVGTVPTIGYFANANKEQQLVEEANKNQQQLSLNNHQIQENAQTNNYLSNLPKAQQLIQQEELVINNQQQKIKSVNNQQIQEQITLNDHQQQHLQEQVSLNQQQQISLNDLVLPTVSYFVNQQNPQVTLTSHQEQIVSTVPTVGYYVNTNKEQQLVQEVNKNQQQLSINNHQIEGAAPTVNYLNNHPKAQQLVQEQASVNTNQQQKIKEVSVNDQQQQKQIQEQVALNDHQQHVQTVSIAPIVNYYTNHPQLNQVTVSNDQHQQISLGNQLQELGAAISYYSNQQKTQKGENQEQLANYYNNLPKAEQLVQEQVSVSNKEEQQQQKIVQEVNHEQKIQEPVIPTISYYTNLLKAQQLKEEVEGNNNRQQESHEQVISTVLPTIGYSKPQLNQNQHVSTISYTSNQPIAQQLLQEHVSINQIQDVKQEKANAQSSQEQVTSKGGLYTNIHQGSSSAGLYGSQETSQVTDSKQQIKPLFNYFTNHQQTHEYVNVNKQQGQGVNGQGAVSYFNYHKKPQQLQVSVNSNQKEESQTDKPTISYYTNHYQQGNDQFTTNQIAYFGHLQQPNLQENVVVIPTQSQIYGASPVHNVVLVNNAPSLSGSISYYNKVTHGENLNNDAYENAYPHPGLYGTKIDNLKQEILTKDKDLVESTRNFVTGQDVLNINNVLSLESHQNSSELFLESTTPSALEITEKYIEGSLTKDPIVVADLEENNLSSEAAVGGYYSSTERTSFQVTQPTLVITPRPVSKQFLAPINAGVQLQSAKDKANDAKLIINIQKSVPYYLGNYQSKVSSDSKAEAQNNVDLIQYSLPTPEALVQLKNHVETNDLLEKTNGQVEGQTQLFDYQKQQKLVVTDNVEHNVQTYLKNIESNQTVKIPEESFGGAGLALNVHLPNHQLNHHLQLPQLYQQTNFANIFALPPLPNIHHQQQVPQEHSNNNNNILLSSYAPNYPPCDNQTPNAKPPATFYQAQNYPSIQTYTDLKPPKPNYKPTHQQKQRNARQSFKQNVRLEYGFMPPLIPSTEIDENGKPIEKSDN